MSHDVFRVFPTLALTWPQSRGTIHRELAGGDSGERQCLTGCYTANIACNTLRTSIRVASGKIPRRLTNRSLSTALSWPATTWPLCRQIGKVYETDKHAHSSSSKRVVVISSRRPSASQAAAASAQPALGCSDGLIVSTPGAASISTSSASPATSNSGLARRIPLE